MPELVESRDTARDGGRGAADDAGIEPEINSDLKEKMEKINAILPFKNIYICVNGRRALRTTSERMVLG